MRRRRLSKNLKELKPRPKIKKPPPGTTCVFGNSYYVKGLSKNLNMKAGWYDIN